MLKRLFYCTENVKSPPGGLFISSTFEGGGVVWLNGEGGVFNLAETHLSPVYQQLSRSKISWTFAYRTVVPVV